MMSYMKHSMKTKKHKRNNELKEYIKAANSYRLKEFEEIYDMEQEKEIKDNEEELQK